MIQQNKIVEGWIHDEIASRESMVVTKNAQRKSQWI